MMRVASKDLFVVSLSYDGLKRHHYD